MPPVERSSLKLKDDDGNRLNAIWSRSGKRLILTVTAGISGEARQIELRAGQVEVLARFLVAETEA
jgi:hypothetical protein